jgi:ABC-type bacteriocin/lantibiotic exporter with double-glycine peptidase domain
VKEKNSELLLAIKDASSDLGKKTMTLFWVLSAARILVGLLDVFGVFILGLFSAQALKQPANTATSFAGLQGTGTAPLTLLGLALVLLTAKSCFSYILNYFLIGVMNDRCSKVIYAKSSLIYYSDIEILNQFSTQKLHFLLTAGVRARTLGILMPLSVIMVEGFLVTVFFVYLLVNNILAALLAFAILGITSILLHQFLAKRQYRNGQLTGSAAIRSLSSFQDTIHGYKELLVNGNLAAAIERFSSIEAETGSIQTRQTILGVLPRHVLESAVMVTLGSIAMISSLLGKSESAIVLLTIFGAAAARILPSLVPLQTSLAEIQINLGKASEVSAIGDLGGKSKRIVANQDGHFEGNQNRLLVRFAGVTYRYPEAKIEAVAELTFEFSGPGWYAIDGPSGSGKSTIFDILMGVSKPQYGNVTINGVDPWTYIQANPGYCSYLPQRISVFNSSIAENVAFGQAIEQIDISRVISLLELVGLEELAQRLKSNPLEPIGEMADNVSGGQLQRLGIARCMYTNPSIFLFDESTSGLDSASQKSILDLIEDLSKTCMVISISHDHKISDRASQIVRIETGRVKRIELR